MAAYEATHGRKPSLPETADLNPDMYRAFVRYVALREMLRGGGGGGTGGGSAGGDSGTGSGSGGGGAGRAAGGPLPGAEGRP